MLYKHHLKEFDSWLENSLMNDSDKITIVTYSNDADILFDFEVEDISKKNGKYSITFGSWLMANIDSRSSSFQVLSINLSVSIILLMITSRILGQQLTSNKRLVFALVRIQRLYDQQVLSLIFFIFTSILVK